MKIATIVGARPQFVKAAVVSRAFKKYRQDVDEIIIHTGQHYDHNMSDVFFEEMNIPKPNYHLGIGGGTHGQNTGRMLEKIEDVLHKEKPDWLLVYGDTDSTLAGALSAAKLNIPVAHVEAGLRSFNKAMPEEINRILTDHISSLLFTPTDTATQNLVNEGVIRDHVKQVGDVMQDATLFYSDKAQKPSKVHFSEKFILSTIHRAENTDSVERLTNIISALNKIAQTVQIVMPVHPRTRKILADTGLDTKYLTLIEPVGYLQMLWLLEQCELVVTDSGGLQKEAFFFGKPCVTTRDETEWVELVENGVNILTGANEAKIIQAVEIMQKRTVDSQLQMYGAGTAGEAIVRRL